MDPQSLADILLFKRPPMGDPVPWPDFQKFLDKQQVIDITNAALEYNNTVIEAQQTVLKAQTGFNAKVTQILKSAKTMAATAR